MRCFEHEDRESVGMCRACLRGVCRACAVPMRLGLACRDRCEADVGALAETLEQSMQTARISGGVLKQTPVLWLGLALISIAVGVFVLLFGLSLPSFRSIALLGIPFLAIGGLVLRVSHGLRAASEAAPDSSAAPPR